MEPIVSPWTIYLIETVIPSIKCVDAISALVLVFSLIEYGAETSDIHMHKPSGNAQRQQFWKCLCIASAVVSIMALFLPDKTTAYKMFLATYITPDNIRTGTEITKEVLEQFLNIIVDAINKIN